MEETNKTSEVAFNDKKILFSKVIKAGKRIYYLDVKQNRKNELFLAITESKKIVSGEGENIRVSFEKHKIFLYKEDFEKFSNGFTEALAFIQENQKNTSLLEEDNQCLNANNESNETELLVDNELNDGEIKIDIDF